MNDFLMKPKIDFAFKEIMADPLSRIGFLSAVLKLDPGEIKETRILNTNLRKLHTDEKQGILDVRILMNDHTEINIEIQLSELKVWAERSLFYLSKIFTEQIHEGQSYDVFKKCVSISILNFTLFPKEPEFYSCFRIMEEKRHTIYTDKMEFHVIELPKLPKEWKDENQALLLWAKFINAEKKEEFEMLAEKNTYINHAYQQLQIISQDKEKRLEYEAREKAIRDYNQLMYESEQKGIQQGMQQGIQQGVQQGMQQAIKIITLDYLSDHLPKEKILIKLQQLFNLTEEQSEQYYQTFAADSHLS